MGWIDRGGRGPGPDGAGHTPPPSRATAPESYVVKAGLNTDFPHAGEKRAFMVYPAEGASGPAPVFVPLTGSVESTMDNLTVARSGATSLMAKQGFLVIGPVRACAKQDRQPQGRRLQRPRPRRLELEPLARRPRGGRRGRRFKTDEGPDSTFLIAAVKCAAKSFPVDARRVYLGGISSGGTMTNRALTFRSDFWAGGLPISGEWYVSKDDGEALSFNDARACVASDPHKIFQGRVGPYPLPDQARSDDRDQRLGR